MQVTHEKIFFSNFQNIFLDLTTILGFANYFWIRRELFVYLVILLRFVTVFRILPTLQDRFAKKIAINVFSDLKNILGLSLIGFCISLHRTCTYARPILPVAAILDNYAALMANCRTQEDPKSIESNQI